MNNNNNTTCEAQMTVEDLTSDTRHSVLPLIVVVGIICLIGIVGNIIVLYVHIFKYKKCNFRIFVLYLCVLDLVSCFILIPMHLHALYVYYEVRDRFMCKIFTFFNLTMFIMNTYILLLIAVDRYRKVCKPHHWQMTRRSVLTCLLILSLASLIQAAPVAVIWEIEAVDVKYKDCSLVINICINSDSTYKTFWSLTYLLCLCPNFAILAAILVLYAFVFRRLAKAAAEEKNRQNKTCVKTTPSNDDNAASTPAFGIIRLFKSNDSLQTIGDILPIELPEGARWYNASDAGSFTSCDTVGACTMPQTETKAEKDRLHFKMTSLRQMTSMTFSFTIIYIITGVLYIVIGSQVVNQSPDTNINVSYTVGVLFLFRVYYINFSLHPFLYGFLDPSFRRAISKLPREISHSLRRRLSTSHSGSYT